MLFDQGILGVGVPKSEGCPLNISRIKGYQENQVSPNLADPPSTSFISYATIIYGKKLCSL